MRSWRRRLSRKTWERELDDEMRDHIERQIAANIANGMPLAEARRQATLRFGAVEGAKEDCREQRRGFWFETLWTDTRYGVRVLRKNPGFSAVAILTLALGIGADTAIFSVLNAVVLHPLPYPHADHLALIWTDLRTAGQSRAPFSGPDMMDMKHGSHLLSEVGGIWAGTAALTGVGEPEQIKVGFVTSNFLSILEVPPAKGRPFNAQDDVRGAAPTIILSDGLWRRRYASDPGIVGKTVLLGGEATTVIGVMPEHFRLVFPGDASVPPDVQAWIPFRDDLARGPRDLNFLRVIARLRPGALIPQVQSELHAIASRLRAQYREDDKQGVDFQILSFQMDTTREIRPAVLALFIGVGLVLLIACANVANLLLARASLRQREIALRATLGASRSRIVRQLLTESILLSVLGGAAGLLLAWWGIHWLLALRPKSLFLMDSVDFNFTLLVYAFAVSLLAGALFGLAPAAASWRANLVNTLKSSGKGFGGGSAGSRGVLVASEVALGFVLLIGAGLMIRTFLGLLAVDTGFQAEHVLTFQIAPPDLRYRTDLDKARFFVELQRKLGAVPGVQSVGGVSHLPLDDYPNWYSFYWREGAPPQEQNTALADHRAITPGYFRALGISLVAGRDFTDADDSSHSRVVIVDESLVNRTWPNESALGKRIAVEEITSGEFAPATATVVGVVKHIRYLQLTDDGRLQVYIPYPQSVREKLSFAVRTSGDPLSVA